MRRAAHLGRLAGIDTQRLILDVALERFVIRGTLTAATGERRDFHGWLELNTALETMLATAAEHTTAKAPRTPQ